MKLYVLSIFSLILFTVSCKKEGPGSDNPAYNKPGSLTPVSSTVSFTAEIDGQAWAAEHVLAVHEYTSANGTEVTQYTVKGEKDNDEFMQFALQWSRNERFDPDTYILGTGANGLLATFIMNYQGESWSLVLDGTGRGQVTVEHGAGSNFKGSFEAYMTNFKGDTLFISNGSYASDNGRDA